MDSFELREATGTITKHTFDRRLTAGLHRLVIRFENDYYQPEAVDPNSRDRNLIVHRVKVNGPYGSVRQWSDRFRKLALDNDGKIVPTKQFAERLLLRAYRRAPD